MKSFNVFDISDYGAQTNPGWRVRWGAEGANAVLLVNLDPEKQLREWKLVWSDAPVDVFLRDTEFVAVPAEGHQIHEKTAWLPEFPAAVPSILFRAWDEQRQNIPAPRRKQTTPYITKETAVHLEQEFFERYVAPYVVTHKIFAIAESGVQLCKRLGMTDFETLYVNHYRANTFQADHNIRVTGIPQLEPETQVLVIDDMISSGRTIAAIQEAFIQKGVFRVRFVTLFDIVASREVHDVDSSVESLMPISNFYWIYGRGMDIFDENSRRTQHVYGADKSYESETQEDIDALFNFFNQQS